MGKNSKQPFVSICTPTFNRRPFILTMFECFKNQNYPKDKMEWIIVDDGTDKIEDLIKASGIPQIKYFAIDDKMNLGKKRNFMHEKTRGSIIVYMDDDDYYPPDRVSHAVERLQRSPKALCAGSSELYIYYKDLKKMYQCGPYGPNHSTAATFAFRRELLNQTRYEDHAALAEERAFLKNYTIPFVQLDPLKSILVFSHNHNTFDKKKLLEHGENNFQKTSSRTVDEFIKDKAMKEFYMETIDTLLQTYEPGNPSNKPDVLKQMLEIEEERRKMMEQNAGQSSGQIILNQDGKEIPLNNQQIVQIIQSQQEQLQKLEKLLLEKDGLIKHLITELNNYKN